MRLLLSTLVLLAFAAAAGQTAQAASFYVSSSGSDRSSGRSPAHPWRTVARVNRAHLRAGDSVLFHGGQTFTDSILMPGTSGKAGARIRFASYAGRATISNSGGAVWFSGKRYLTFENLTLTTGGGDSTILGGSSRGSSYITVHHCALVNSAAAGIISPNAADSRWRIEGNTVRHTGDSGIILLGSHFLARRNTITDTGWNPAITYGKHGIYAKGPNVRILGNHISKFSGGSGISLRYHSATVSWNVITGGEYAITYFPNDSVQSTSYVSHNIARDISHIGFYYGDGPGERFIVWHNSFDMSSGSAFDVSDAGATKITIAYNRVRGTYDQAVVARPGTAGTFREHHNRYSGKPEFVWNGVGLAFAAYRAVSGQGVADKIGL
ncbi:MAG: right-handed parallel beta-helix repeat-containing protein [Gaiellaceae bacterium]